MFRAIVVAFAVSVVWLVAGCSSSSVGGTATSTSAASTDVTPSASTPTSATSASTSPTSPAPTSASPAVSPSAASAPHSAAASTSTAASLPTGAQRCARRGAYQVVITTGAITCAQAYKTAFAFNTQGESVQRIGGYICQLGNATTRPIIFTCSSPHAEFSVEQP